MGYDARPHSEDKILSVVSDINETGEKEWYLLPSITMKQNKITNLIYRVMLYQTNICETKLCKGSEIDVIVIPAKNPLLPDSMVSLCAILGGQKFIKF